MRVLHFAPRVCWPLDTGAKLRNYHLARVLAERADVTLLAFGGNEQPPNNPENPYAKVVTVKRDPGYTAAKIIRGAVGRTPLSLLNYTTAAMKQALAQILSEQDFDVVQVESIHLMGYLPILRAATARPHVICDWHNIESELMQRYSERESNLLRRTYARKTARQLRTLEQKATHDFDGHVVVSQRDRERLLQLDSASSISVIENGVDSAYYSDQEMEKAHAAWLTHPHPDRAAIDGVMPSPSKANRIVFVGSMDYHANIDGVVDFAREIWPQIYERNPELVLTIVGRDPAAEVRQLASLRGIEVTGTVADVRPYYLEAVAAIVPLNVGGGSRLKILEAMAAGVAVVSTTLGAEGLEVQHGVNILIADTNAQLLDAITGVVENEGLRQKLYDAGRALVSNRYDWARAGESLFGIYERLLAARMNEKN
ncbi:MAG: polysaccharide biosynthesis protein PslH [Pyrinomonadaceae bacterium]|jgi:sugar transferase (PEP-CTERM/EpsH1 system associated)|nr:polysaccharide biosynthesis protein PslH [Pyrinomonadaceae bacterium]